MNGAYLGEAKRIDAATEALIFEALDLATEYAVRRVALSSRLAA